MNKKTFSYILTLIMLLISYSTAEAKSGELVPLKQYPQSAEVVTVGFYPLTIYGVDPATSTFSYDGYVWFRWKGDLDPTETFEFVNAVDKSSMSRQDLFDAPQPMPDGSKYQIIRVESQFFKPFSLADFPLDRHSLTIEIEDSIRGVDQLVYVIDKADTGYRNSLSIPGWKLNGWSDEQMLNNYGSNFGELKEHAQASRFAQMNFSINISRPESYFLWKLMLPLVVVLCGAWIALLLSPVLIETRAALPATALLTTVFLQQSYSATLPESGSLVLLDKIYVLAYVLIVVTLARIIVKSRNVEQMEEAELQALRKSDAIALVLQVAGFAAATAAIVMLR